MEPIQMVDLKGQHQRIKPELDQAIEKVVNAGAFINGPDVQAFESELAQYLSVNEVIGCANGTDALQIALMALDLPDDAEVIVPDFSFVATVEVVKLLGLKPVFVDVLSDTFNMDPDQVEAVINERTGAIVPVHLFGQCADMEKLQQIAEKHGLYIVEDAAQALGADFTFSDGTCKKAGTMGHIGCTSFFPAKNLGAFGDAGGIFTNDAGLAEKIRLIKNHGMGKPYQYTHVGLNSRLDTLQAAVLRVKLQYLDEYNGRRQAAAKIYNQGFEALPGIQIPVLDQRSTHIYHQYTIKVEPELRDALRQRLDEKDVPNKVFYPDPLHAHKVYNDPDYRPVSLKNTENLAKSVIALPMHTELTREQQEWIIDTIHDFEKQKT